MAYISAIWRPRPNNIVLRMKIPPLIIELIRGARYAFVPTRSVSPHEGVLAPKTLLVDNNKNAKIFLGVLDSKKGMAKAHKKRVACTRYKSPIGKNKYYIFACTAYLIFIIVLGVCQARIGLIYRELFAQDRLWTKEVNI